LKIEGVAGESVDAKHKDEIQVDSWSLGGRQAGTFANGGGGGAGKVKMNDVSFTAKVSTASPKLFLLLATGTHIGRAVLTVRKAGGKQEAFLIVTFTDVLVSSYQTGSSAKVPVDSFTLNFARIQIEYKPQSADGKLGAAVRSGFDLKSMKVV
jgi:type VI secretion system secreted protein Hcp